MCLIRDLKKVVSKYQTIDTYSYSNFDNIIEIMNKHNKYMISVMDNNTPNTSKIIKTTMPILAKELQLSNKSPKLLDECVYCVTKDNKQSCITEIWYVGPITFKFACNNGYMEVAKFLYDNEPKKYDADMSEIFRMCCIKGHLSIAKWLYKMDNTLIDTDIYVDIKILDDTVRNWLEDTRVCHTPMTKTC